ncbi:peptidase-like protein, partial [Candidatus Magnetomorum sp. HK-1]
CTLTIPIKVSNDGDELPIYAFQMFLVFDKASLTFERVDTSDTLSENMYDASGTVDPDDAGRIKLSGIEFSNPPVIEANSQDNIFLNLIFSVNPEATTDSDLQITDLKDDFKDSIVLPGLFTYIHPPRPVYVLNVISDLTIDEDAAPTLINLRNCFADPDHGPITSGIIKEIVQNSNSSLVQAVIDGDQLTLTLQKDQFGQAEIEIKATSDGDVITDRFTINVNSVCDGPEIINTIPDSVALMGDENTILSLDQYFKDVDQSEPFIPIVANSSNLEIVSPEVNRKTLTLTYSDSQSGIVDIEVIAISDCLRLTQSFQVIVKDPSELPPKYNLTSDMQVLPGSTLILSLFLENNPEYQLINGVSEYNIIYGIDVRLSDSNNILELLDIDLSGGLVDGYDVNMNKELFDIALNVNGSNQAHGNGKLMDIQMKVKDDIAVTSTELSFIEFDLNETPIDHNQVTIAIKQPPIVVNINLSVNENELLIADLSQFASDSDNDPLTFSVEQQGIKGECHISPSGAFFYTPLLNQNGSDAVVIAVNDSEYAPVTAIVSIAITPVNNCPVAKNNTIDITETVAYTGILSYSDPDIDDNHQFRIVDNPTHGVLSLNSETGEFTYTPDNLIADASDEFTFIVSDSTCDSNAGKMTVSIAANDDTPTIAAIPYQEGNKNVSLSVSCTIDDQDTPLENLNLSYISSDDNLIESITFSGTDHNRTLLIQPGLDKTGEADITIEVSDGSSAVTNTFNLSIRNIEIGFTGEGCTQTAPGETGSISFSLMNSAISPTDIQLTVSYDPGILSPVGLDLSGSFFENDPYTNTFEIIPDEGKVNINIQLAASAIEGLVGNLSFNVNENAIVGQSTSVVIVDSTINNQSISANGSCFSITGSTVHGVVRHFNGKPVPNVQVELVGKRVYHILTDQSGTYTFVGIPEGSYTISFYKDDDLKYGPGALDVSIIGQISVQQVPPELSCYQKIAADVTQNFEISSTDAGMLALYAAELRPYLNVDNNHWTFVTHAIDTCEWYNSDAPIVYQSTKTFDLTSDFFLEVTAVRLGDVSGYFKPDSEGNKTTRRKRSGRPGKIAMIQHSQKNIPIVLSEYTDVAGVDLKIRYNADYLRLDEISLEDCALGVDYQMIVNTSKPGEIIALIYSSYGSSIVSGKILDLTFTALQKGNSNIILEKFSCNETDTPGGFQPQEFETLRPVDNLMVFIKEQLYLIK